MHMYQKHILDLLRGTSHLCYTELQPDGVESSHFKYHLDQLVKEGLVERVNRGVYGLTPQGKMSVDRLSVGRINPELTPKVITYTLLQDSEFYYLFRKDKEPFLDRLNMVSGKLHLNERSADASVREVDEKTGIAISHPTLKTVAEVRIHEDNQLVSHFVAYVFVAELAETSEKLEVIPKKSLAMHNDLARDLLPLLDAVRADETFVELDLDMDTEIDKNIKKY